MLDEAHPPEPETMAQRHGRMLARLAELSLAAEDLAARAGQAEEPRLAADLHMAFAKAGRCLRQTVMLEARLAEIATRAAPQPAPTRAVSPRAPDADVPTPVGLRKERLEMRLEPLVWERLEDPDAQWKKISELYQRLAEEGQAPGFLQEPFRVQLARLTRALGLQGHASGKAPAPPRPPPGHAHLDTGRWRGSG